MTDNNSHAAWTKELFDIFSHAGISIYPYIPDAAYKRNIDPVACRLRFKAHVDATAESR